MQFFVQLEAFLDAEGYWVRLDSFALNGNVRSKSDNKEASADDIDALMQQFFKKSIHRSKAAAGAADALKRLSAHAEVCVLTNLPGPQRQSRADSLKNQGMDYPVICNSGGKGPAVRRLMESWSNKAAFIDDLPPNHSSVKAEAPDVFCIHFVADPRLSDLISTAKDADARAKDWSELETILEAWLHGRKDF